MTHRINLRDWESAGLLAGRITALCRVVRPAKRWAMHTVLRPDMAAFDHQVWWHYHETDRVGHLQTSPFGVPGDVVLGREAWATGCNLDQWSAATIASEAANYGYNTEGSSHSCCPLFYKADGGKRLWSDTEQDDIRAFGARGRWRSSTTMPDWAARHRLTTKSVRCVRVREVDAVTALKLGVRFASDKPTLSWVDQFNLDNPTALYADNPWAWVGEFKP